MMEKLILQIDVACRLHFYLVLWIKFGHDSISGTENQVGIWVAVLDWFFAASHRFGNPTLKYALSFSREVESFQKKQVKEIWDRL